MPNVAIIDIATGKVQGCIVASVDDRPYPGTRFEAVPETEDGAALVDDRYEWDQTEKRIKPNAELAAKIEAQRIEDERTAREERENPPKDDDDVKPSEDVAGAP